MEEIVTKAEFARRRGVERSAINQWVKRGMLTKAAVNERGRIIVAVAEAELRNRLNTVRSRTQIAAAARARSRKAATAAPHVNGAAAKRHPGPPEDPLLDLRLAKERLEIRRRER